MCLAQQQPGGHPVLQLASGLMQQQQQQQQCRCLAGSDRTSSQLQPSQWPLLASTVANLTNGAVSASTVIDTLAVCFAKPNTGSCRASFVRYYFNVTTNTCQTFTWGGCLGNGNNFDSAQACKDKCNVDQLQALLAASGLSASALAPVAATGTSPAVASGGAGPAGSQRAAGALTGADPLQQPAAGAPASGPSPTVGASNPTTTTPAATTSPTPTPAIGATTAPAAITTAPAASTGAGPTASPAASAAAPTTTTTPAVVTPAVPPAAQPSGAGSSPVVSGALLTLASVAATLLTLVCVRMSGRGLSKSKSKGNLKWDEANLDENEKIKVTCLHRVCITAMQMRIAKRYMPHYMPHSPGFQPLKYRSSRRLCQTRAVAMWPGKLPSLKLLLLSLCLFQGGVAITEPTLLEGVPAGATHDHVDVARRKLLAKDGPSLQLPPGVHELSEADTIADPNLLATPALPPHSLSLELQPQQQPMVTLLLASHSTSPALLQAAASQPGIITWQCRLQQGSVQGSGSAAAPTLQDTAAACCSSADSGLTWGPAPCPPPCPEPAVSSNQALEVGREASGPMRQQPGMALPEPSPAPGSTQPPSHTPPHPPGAGPAPRLTLASLSELPLRIAQHQVHSAQGPGPLLLVLYAMRPDRERDMSHCCALQPAPTPSPHPTPAPPTVPHPASTLCSSSREEGRALTAATPPHLSGPQELAAAAAAPAAVGAAVEVTEAALGWSAAGSSRGGPSALAAPSGLLSLLPRHGLVFAPLDLEQPLHLMPVLLHKASDELQPGATGAPVFSPRLLRLRAWLEQHPEVVVVDPFDCTAKVIDRVLMCKTTQAALTSPASTSTHPSPAAAPPPSPPTSALPPLPPAPAAPDLTCPVYCVLASSEAAHVAATLASAGLHPPCIVKTAAGCGLAHAHRMLLLTRMDCLATALAGGWLPLPVVVQQFEDHGGKVAKVYVAGDKVFTSFRPSIPNLAMSLSHSGVPQLGCSTAASGPAAGPWATLARQGYLAFDSLKSLPTHQLLPSLPCNTHPHPAVQLPPSFPMTTPASPTDAQEVADVEQVVARHPELLQVMAQRLREHFGLTLFGFDVILVQRQGRKEQELGLAQGPGWEQGQEQGSTVERSLNAEGCGVTCGASMPAPPAAARGPAGVAAARAELQF
ncbi:hypothetical protein QJQ45_028064 [Haematococcus lacustris]|nr:hypothetical protein QJQ45_028064 [Haematococcus lacustris]